VRELQEKAIKRRPHREIKKRASAMLLYTAPGSESGWFLPVLSAVLF
tara:strand:- start:814 stop:954 length:141 start_codon:yes stop_codon:yes gene_type:complete